MVTYTYNGEGSLHCAAVTKGSTTTRYLYNYDSLGRLISSEQKNGGTTVLRTHQDFNEHNQLTVQSWQIGETAYSQQYEYNADDGSLAKVTTSDGRSIAMSYDSLRRLSQKVLQIGDDTFLTNSITYNPGTMQIKNYGISTSGFNTTYSYIYDASGNILSVSDGTNTTRYVYDSQNQLIRENNPAAGKTWTWEYDSVGTIRNRKEYAYTTAEDLGAATPNSTAQYIYYDSQWKDLLTGYNGHDYHYDELGNLTDDGTWMYEWEHGRQLASMNSGPTTWSYEYDADGMRTSRTNGTTTYNYIYNGSNLSQMTVGGNTLYFAYDASGIPMSVNYNDTDYYYVTNLQGDVTAILNASGTAVVQYTYDAWGNILTTGGTMASTLGVHNPLRYRGYVYDPETGFYYLQSRYYDPEIGRFINADDIACLGADGTPLSYNLFAYCVNNPVNRTDVNGNWSGWATAGVIVGTVLCVAAITILTCGVGTATLAGAVAVGAAKGALIGAAAGTVAGTGIGYAATGTLEGAKTGAAVGFGVGSLLGAVLGGSHAASTFIPQEAYDTLNYVDQNGRPPQGYKGGKVFQNDGRGGGQVLPGNNTTYAEYDIHPKVPGVPRDAQRIVIGSDGSAWYTADHYTTFVNMRR